MELKELRLASRGSGWIIAPADFKRLIAAWKAANAKSPNEVNWQGTEEYLLFDQQRPACQLGQDLLQRSVEVLADLARASNRLLAFPDL